MRVLLIIFLGFLTAPSILAQEWQVDIEKAKQLASKEDRKIVLVFQGSDWCAPCIKLQKEVWDTREFKD